MIPVMRVAKHRLTNHKILLHKVLDICLAIKYPALVANSRSGQNAPAPSLMFLFFASTVTLKPVIAY
jgi:hypothetical protein